MLGLPLLPKRIGLLVPAEVMQNTRRHVEAEACGRVLVDIAAAGEDCGSVVRRVGVAKGASHGFHVRGAKGERADRVGKHLGKPCPEKLAKPSWVDLVLGAWCEHALR